MKKKDVIKLIIICFVLLILFVLVIFIVLKDRIQIPFECNKLERLADIREFKKINKLGTINKIEVVSQSTRNEFIIKKDIDKILSFLETIEGYRTSISNVYLTNEAYEIFIYCDSTELIQIRVSQMNFNIGNGTAYNNKYYKNSKDYYVLIRNLVEDINKD